MLRRPVQRPACGEELGMAAVQFAEVQMTSAMAGYEALWALVVQQHAFPDSRVVQGLALGLSQTASRLGKFDLLTASHASQYVHQAGMLAQPYPDAGIHKQGDFTSSLHTWGCSWGPACRSGQCGQG